MKPRALAREADELWHRMNNPATAHQAFKEVLATSPPAIVNLATKICLLANERGGAVLPGDRGIIVHGSISLDLFMEVFPLMSETVSALAFAVFSNISDTERRELGRIVTDRLKKPASLEMVGAQGRSVLQVLVAALVESEVEALRPVLEHRVKELVRERWEKEVDALARTRLDAALAKVRKELAP